MSNINADSRSIGQKALLVLLLVFGLFLIFRTVLVQSANQAGQTLPFSVWPDDAVQIMHRAGIVSDQMDWAARSTAQVMEPVRAAVKADPLDDWAFLVAGIKARDDDRIALSEAALKAAKLRDPRAFGPRYYLIQHYLLQNQPKQAMEEIIAASRLRNDPRLIQALLLLSQTPDGEVALLEGIKNDSNVRDRLLHVAADADGYQDLIATLLSSNAIDQSVKFQVVSRTAKRGNFELARTFWSIADPATNKDALIFDGGFDGRAAPSPFGWTLSHNSYVAAAFTKGSESEDVNLDVEYFGVREVEAASQVLFLKPGAYRLKATGKAVDPQASSGDMIWIISCVKKPDSLVKLSFAASEAGARSKAIQFDVPSENCAQQQLFLVGKAQMSPSPYRMRFSNIALEGI